MGGGGEAPLRETETSLASGSRAVTSPTSSTRPQDWAPEACPLNQRAEKGWGWKGPGAAAEAPREFQKGGQPVNIPVSHRAAGHSSPWGLCLHPPIYTGR